MVTMLEHADSLIMSADSLKKAIEQESWNEAREHLDDIFQSAESLDNELPEE